MSWRDSVGLISQITASLSRTHFKKYIVLAACQPCLVPLLGNLPEQGSSIHFLLLALESQARILLDKIGKSSANGSVPKSGKAHSDKMADKSTDDKLAK